VEQNKPQDVMICLSPHADDVELAMGGYMARRVEEGSRVISVLLSSSTYMSTGGRTVFAQERVMEHMKACTVLGVEAVVMPMFEENEALLAPRGDVVKMVYSLIHQFEPTELFVPLPWFNQDHTVVWEAVLAATRPVFTIKQVPEIWAYEMPGQDHGPISPVGQFGWCYVVLTDAHMVKKRHAIEAHDSQMAGKEGHLIGVTGSEALARLRALEAGPEINWAERFALVKWVHRLQSESAA
jgi:LmbE family N-acetylglucosaminyl deacetylase